MPDRGFRFLHAADFRLHEPITGLAEVPDRLRPVVREAPYRAAERVFDLTIERGGDFLILTGQLLDPSRTGPRGPLFLQRQLARLADREIPVYWLLGGEGAASKWPATVPLPPNVHRVAAGSEAVHRSRRGDGVRICNARGVSASAAALDVCSAFTITVVESRAELVRLLPAAGYAIVVGSAAAAEALPPNALAARPCQGRDFDDAGPHGCTLVEVSDGGATSSLLPADAVRFHEEQLEIPARVTADELMATVRRRAESLADANADTTLLVAWRLTSRNPLALRALVGRIELAQAIRGVFEGGRLWTVSLDVATPNMLSEDWLDEETIRGEFLRAARQAELDADPFDLRPYLPPSMASAGLGEWDDVASRSAVLREATLLGAELLSGESREPAAATPAARGHHEPSARKEPGR